MYLLENPVLQRELLINLRRKRSFVLLLLYNAVLAAVVYFAWPQQLQLDLTTTPEQTIRLIQLFFLGQFALAVLLSPSFAAESLTGEKERRTYEMLLASPLSRGAIVLGKLLASLAHLAILIVTSLPIVMLCLPLGGVSLYEILALYLALVLSVALFGMISLACSSYFQRTSAALIASYVIILPLAMLGVLFWSALGGEAKLRLLMAVTVVPAICFLGIGLLYASIVRRLQNPVELGSEGREVIDLERESKEAVGLVIDRNQFPDKLFAPAKRTGFLPDGANPVYDKEMRSEIFSQGTLMLRIVIQVSMLVAIPLMAICLFVAPINLPWYIGYVLLFNVLVGPVFSAGSISSEREHETLDLLLTTNLSPGQILSGKLLAGLRVSGVLTAFLLWPLVIACVLPLNYWSQLPAIGAQLLLVSLSCLTTTTVGLFFSVLLRKTSAALTATYLALVILYGAPMAARYFAATFFPNSQQQAAVQTFSMASPLAASFEVPWTGNPFSNSGDSERGMPRGDWSRFALFICWILLVNGVLLGTFAWLFRRRWRLGE